MADRISAASGAYPKWVPTDLVAWFGRVEGKWPEREMSLYNRLARDDRMRDVWAWHSRIANDVPRAEKSSVGFCLLIEQATQMPSKPGNLSPKHRELYLSKVRTRAEALIELLGQTKYDCSWDEGKEISSDINLEEKIGSNISSALRFAKSEDAEFLIAYSVTRRGVTELPWDYPASHLTDLLRSVVEWTRDDDYWGRGYRGLQSSKPISQSGERARVHYFNCILYERFFRNSGLPIPFSILATLANVALELPADKEVHEETAQKQVKRYLDKMDPAEVPKALPPHAFDDPPF